MEKKEFNAKNLHNVRSKDNIMSKRNWVYYIEQIPTSDKFV